MLRGWVRGVCPKTSGSVTPQRGIFPARPFGPKFTPPNHPSGGPPNGARSRTVRAPQNLPRSTRSGPSPGAASLFGPRFRFNGHAGGPLEDGTKIPLPGGSGPHRIDHIETTQFLPRTGRRYLPRSTRSGPSPGAASLFGLESRNAEGPARAGPSAHSRSAEADPYIIPPMSGIPPPPAPMPSRGPRRRSPRS